MAKIQITPDYNKAQSLFTLSNETFRRLTEISLNKYPTNSIIDYYDICHKLLDAIFLLKGFKFKGDGAHFEMISESASFSILSSAQINFFQQLRDTRNRIHYEGLSISEDFLKRNTHNLTDLRESLHSYCNEHLY